MKAAILVESKKPLLIENIDLPTKLEFGQVLVKISYSDIWSQGLSFTLRLSLGSVIVGLVASLLTLFIFEIFFSKNI